MHASYINVAQDTSGNVLGNYDLEVLDANTGLPAPLYDNILSLTPRVNSVVTTDEKGTFSFYATGALKLVDRITRDELLPLLILDAPVLYDVSKFPWLARPTDADATSKIQAAINAARDAGGGTVFLPAIYQITTLDVPDIVSIEGIGATQAGLYQIPTAVGPTIRALPYQGVTSGMRAKQAFRTFTIDGNNAGCTTTNLTASFVQGATTIAVQSTVGLFNGMLIDAIGFEELTQIQSITGNVITLSKPTLASNPGPAGNKAVKVVCRPAYTRQTTAVLNSTQLSVADTTNIVPGMRIYGPAFETDEEDLSQWTRVKAVGPGAVTLDRPAKSNASLVNTIFYVENDGILAIEVDQAENYVSNREYGSIEVDRVQITQVSGSAFVGRPGRDQIHIRFSRFLSCQSGGIWIVGCSDCYVERTGTGSHWKMAIQFAACATPRFTGEAYFTYRRDIYYDVRFQGCREIQMANCDVNGRVYVKGKTGDGNNIATLTSINFKFRQGNLVPNSSSGTDAMVIADNVVVVIQGGGFKGEATTGARSNYLVFTKNQGRALVTGMHWTDNPVNSICPYAIAITNEGRVSAQYLEDASGTFVGNTVSAGVASVNGRQGVVTITKTDVGLANVDNTSDAGKPISTATQAALNLKATIDSPAFTGTVTGITKASVGLANVDNTSDANKPISTLTATALALKAPVNSPTFTGTVSGITKAMVGLGNVDNTADADKPVPAAVQTSLALKANLNSPTFTGTVAGITKAMVGLANVDNTPDITKPISTDTQAALNLKAPLASPTFTGTVAGITKAMVGLSNVDNTSDASKPISTAAQTALNLKAPLASPTFTGTVAGITKAMVGLGAVDNTADADKPISILTQAALDLKANINSPTFTGTVAGITKAMVGLGSVDNTSDANKPISSATQTALNLKANLNSPTFTGTVTGISKASVGLANVDNTSDALKPISTATQIALDLKAPINNPTFTGTVAGVTKAMVGLGNVDNTADSAKPISTVQQAALDLKAPIASPTFTGTVSGITKAMVGLSAVDNTADLDKPISTAATIALAAKAPLASPTFTGTVSGITKTMVGLGNVDNTSDVGKPISSATQVALDAKQNLLTAGTGIAIVGNLISATGSGGGSGVVDGNKGDLTVSGSGTAWTINASTITNAKSANMATATIKGRASAGTGAPEDLTASQVKSLLAVSKSDVGLVNVDNTADVDKPVSTATQTALNLKANLNSPTFTGTVAGITKTMVGLANVDNTADSAKPVSVPQQAALDLKANLASPTFTGSVGGITKFMVGLTNVDNTADVDKPVSTATQTALDLKQNILTAGYGINIVSDTISTTAGLLSLDPVSHSGADNSGATVTTTAMQAALNAALTDFPAFGSHTLGMGAPVTPQHGTYRVNVLTLSSLVSIVNAGTTGSVVFEQDHAGISATTAMFTIQPDGITELGAYSQATIQGIVINGRRTSAGHGQQVHGLYAPAPTGGQVDMRYPAVYRTLITGTTGTGFMAFSEFDKGRLIDVRSLNNGQGGAYVEGGLDWKMRGVTFANNLQYQLWLKGAYSTVVDGFEFLTPGSNAFLGKWALLVDNCFNARFLNGEIAGRVLVQGTNDLSGDAGRFVHRGITFNTVTFQVSKETLDGYNTNHSGDGSFTYDCQVQIQDIDQVEFVNCGCRFASANPSAPELAARPSWFIKFVSSGSQTSPNLLLKQGSVKFNNMDFTHKSMRETTQPPVMCFTKRISNLDQRLRWEGPAWDAPVLLKVATADRNYVIADGSTNLPIAYYPLAYLAGDSARALDDVATTFTIQDFSDMPVPSTDYAYFLRAY